MMRFALFLPILIEAKSQASDAEAALLALDTDHSGKVERREMEAFAVSQGLTLAQVTEEFKSIDTNGDGELEAKEISQMMVEEAKSVTPTAPKLQAAPQKESLVTAEEDLDVSAEQAAGRAVAQVFEKKAAESLLAMRQDSAEAEKLEEVARSLRGQAEEVRNVIAEQSVAAARSAAGVLLAKSKEQVKAMAAEQAAAEQEVLDILEPSGFRRGFLNFGSPCEMKTRDLSERRSVLVLVPISTAFG